MHNGCVKILGCLTFSASLVSCLAFSSSASATDPSSSATATVHVSEACSLTSTVITPHTDNMGNGTYTDSLGSTKFTVKCNDASGFALYAIGYSGDEYGATSMLGDNELSIPTGTDASAGNTTSHWSMKISKDTTSYLPNSLTIENSFNSQHLIPSTYTKIASFPSSTDGTNGTGSSILATYGVRISGTQAAGTYIGKVKYTLVHPNMVDDSNKPVYPLTEDDCPAGYVCYAPNTSDIEGSMASISNETIAASDKAGKISVGQSVSATPTLIAPNYKRSGYGFAGWSTEYNYTSTSASPIYGPNQTITVDLSDSGLILYPVWVASTGNLQNWNGCSSLTAATYNTSNHTITADLSSVTALTDTRDGNVYAVARLADGLCWMIENLRLDDSTILTVNNTNNPLHNTNNTVTLNANGTITTHLAASSSGTWCSDYNAACIDQTMLNTNNTRLSDSNLAPSYSTNDAASEWYGYGNYYNWYSATAGNGAYSKTTGNVDGDLCPTGWHLPYGGSGTGTSGGNTVGGFYYLNTQMSNNTSTQGSKDWHTYPNNFVYSGDWYGSQAGVRGSYGYYWSSSARSSNYAYNLLFTSGNVYPGTNYSNKYFGFSVRCVISLPTIDDVESLQDFNSFSSQEMTSVLNSMTTGQAYHIPDNRDNESYTIAKLADGNVWMLDNLKLDLSNSSVKANLNSGTTNAENSSLTSLASNVTDGTINSYTTPQIVTAYKNTTNGTPYGNGSGKAGIYYNYCAASAGTICDNSSTSDATSDICPAGWRLPTGGSGGEFQDLCLAYDSNCSSGGSSLTASNTASVQYNLSLANAGWARNSDLYMQTYGVFLWSSTYSEYNNGPTMYDMYLTNTGANSIQSFVTRDYGISMRCIVNK